MRYAFLFLLAGCSSGAWEKEVDDLKSKASKSPAWTASPAGSAAEIETRLLRLLEPEPHPDFSVRPALEDLVRHALARNPELRARVKRLEAALEQVPQAASAPDPELELALTLEDFVQTFGKFMIGLMQPILFPGKLDAAARAALERAWEEWGGLLESMLEVRAQVARDYADLYAIDHARRIAGENLKLLEQLETVARTRFEARQVPQQDVLKVRLRALETENDLIRLTRDRTEAETRLNALLGRRDPARIGDAVVAEEPAESAPLPNLVTVSLERRPQTAARTHALRRALAELRLAELDSWPDPAPGIEYEVTNGGKHSLTPKLTLPLPFVRSARRAAARAQMRALLGETWHRYEGARIEIVREVASAHARVRSTRDSTILYRDKLRPQSRQTYEAALAGYRAGEVDFLTAVDALLEQRKIEEQYYRLVADHFAAREELRRAVGE